MLPATTLVSSSRIELLQISPSNLLKNGLLSALSKADFALLEPHLVVASYSRRAVLAEAHAEHRHVHFPLSGLISLTIEMANGEAVETSFIGRDGAFGASSGVSLSYTPVRAVAHADLVAASVTTAIFHRLVSNSEGLQVLCARAGNAQLAQTHITSACNTLHKVEQRFCRWLVQTHDVTDSDTVVMTQEFLSEVLGVRRTSVNEVASKLQSAGLINYSRGTIRIVDLPALEARSCECTQLLRFQRTT